MIRVCEFCSSEFEGAAQARFCSDAHRKAFARSGPPARVEQPEPVESEQALRERLGYSISESRTKEERDAVARRILARSRPGVEVPEDIREVWGDDPFPARAIEVWGLDAFRASMTHRLAVEQAARDEKLAPVRTAFVKAHARA